MNACLPHTNQERPIRCRNCQELYLEPQNHDLCCAYHPGEYKRACPRSCPGLTEKCMSHRCVDQYVHVVLEVSTHRVCYQNVLPILFSSLQSTERNSLPTRMYAKNETNERVMRWTCCDKNEPGTWGSSGCKNRCHFPPFEGHPKFINIVRKVGAGSCVISFVANSVVSARP